MPSDRMSKDDSQKYSTIPVTNLRIRRRGKHHELVHGILNQLQQSAEGAALIVPLDSIGSVSRADLRSAVMRAASAKNVHVKTYSDEKNFYVWRKERSRNKRPKPK